ncbi:MAG: TIGR03915 family putative DNA repair protein [Bacteroidetes bacterium]|nr:TIGR03915 family putative DNA repair protein [Bacteroidota bacterium]
MDVLVYDKTFEGFLSAVFYVYEYKLADVHICKEVPGTMLFGRTMQIDTDEAKAKRVLAGLSKKLSHEGLQSIYHAYLADTLQEEDTMLAYIRHALASDHNIEKDYSNFAVLRMQRVDRMVHRERHRMKAFIRFKLTKDNIFYDGIEPDFNVIPLIREHFEKRYADQQWIIYDLRRGFGIYYDLQKVETITITFSEESQGADSILWMDQNEALYQTLWQQYFKSTNIASRKNMKLHIRHVPKRYWKHLTEKALM